MANLEIVIWDVNHGNAIYVRTPNEKDILIDCGNNDTTGFSPSEYIKNLDRSIDYLIISHPHCDHISDIENFIRYHYLSRSASLILERPKISYKTILEANQEQCKNIVDTYYEFQKNFNSEVSGEASPENSQWGGGAKIVSFNIEEETSNINNMSIVSFLNYKTFTMLFPGDIEASGWKKLLERTDFVEWLRKTKILLAPHHGRETGYCNDIFEYFTPYLTIVSDGRFGDTSATNRYSLKSKGWKVWKSNGEGIERKVLTTRQDGAINLEVGENSDGRTFIKVNIK